jgi:hypothetical protein
MITPWTVLEVVTLFTLTVGSGWLVGRYAIDPSTWAQTMAWGFLYALAAVVGREVWYRAAVVTIKRQRALEGRTPMKWRSKMIFGGRGAGKHRRANLVAAYRDEPPTPEVPPVIDGDLTAPLHLVPAPRVPTLDETIHDFFGDECGTTCVQLARKLVNEGWDHHPSNLGASPAPSSPTHEPVGQLHALPSTT